MVAGHSILWMIVFLALPILLVIIVKKLNDRYGKLLNQPRFVGGSPPQPSPASAGDSSTQYGVPYGSIGEERERYSDPYMEVARVDDLLGAVTDVRYEGNICDLFVTERGVGIVNLLSLPRLDSAEKEMMDPHSAREVARRGILLVVIDQVLQQGEFRRVEELKGVVFPSRNSVVFEWSDEKWQLYLPPGGAKYLLEVLRRGPYAALINEGPLRENKSSLQVAPTISPSAVGGRTSQPEELLADLGVPIEGVLAGSLGHVRSVKRSTSNMEVKLEDGREKLKCPGCGIYVDLSWDTCPNCGKDLRPLKAQYEAKRPIFTAIRHSQERLKSDYGEEGNFSVKVRTVGRATQIQCPHCKTFVDISLDRCPHCGEDLKPLRALYEERSAFLNEILR